MNLTQKVVSQNLENLEVQDRFYKVANWEKENDDGPIFKGNDGKRNKSLFFDSWTGNLDTNSKWKSLGSIGRAAIYFGICEGAEIWVAQQSERERIGKSNKGRFIWMVEEKDRPKIENRSDWKIKLHGSKLNKWEKLIDQGEKCLAKLENNFESVVKNESWIINKLKSLNNPKGLVIWAESELQEQKKKNSYLRNLLIEKEMTDNIVGKIRLIHIEKDNEIMYVDEWVREITSEDIKKFKKEIEKVGKCLIEEELNSQQTCKGRIKLKNVATDGVGSINDSNIESKRWEDRDWVIETNSRNGQKNEGYEQQLRDNWENIAQNIRTKYLIWSREIGIVWQGKAFKWRSF